MADHVADRPDPEPPAVDSSPAAPSQADRSPAVPAGSPDRGGKWRWGRGCLLGCGGTALAALLLVGGLIAWRVHERRQRVRAEEMAREQARQEELKQFDRVVEKLAPAAPPAASYDLDRTIKVIHGIDEALRTQQDFQTCLAQIMQTDTRGVAPDLLEARAEIFRVLRDLYGRQEELAAKESLWRYAGEFFLQTLGMFNINVSALDPLVGTDRESARQALAELKTRYSEIDTLQQAIRERENDLFETMYGYATSYYRYLAQWDQLCLRRDRAYLAAAAGQWPQAIEAAREAIAMAPHETEAHLLLAWALIEHGGETGVQEAGALLHGYLDRHPDRSAPALLLLGVLHARAGNREEASLQLSQAAAYYPKQADLLSDMLDPYRQRAFLRKSREGNYILHQYRNVMLGAGYFSPDLQIAKQLYDQGQREAGNQKVFDHFYRRRLQQKWDFVLSDIDFCYGFLDTRFQEIYPESSYLDLEASPGTFGSKLKVGVRNRSDRTLHNASLLLCLHLTDMISGDYVALQAGPTQPAILANAVTDFGEVEIRFDTYGMKKTVADIVAARAILVSQEAVVWVDTETYRIAEAQEFRAQRQRGEPAPALEIDWVRQLQTDPQALLGNLLKDVHIDRVDNRWGKDAVTVSLPKELAILRPIFRLMANGQTLAPSQNRIAEDRIALTFDKVAEFAEQDVNQLELVLNSPFTDVLLKWLATQDRSRYELKDVAGK